MCYTWAICRKLVGARYYLKGYESDNGPLNATTDYRSARDKDGHGTHTASTVGGRRVRNVSAQGFAPGTASGGAPLARLAIYKVCWPIKGQTKAKGNTCYEEDMLAAIDDAIADGVHVLSISIGTSKPIAYVKDGIAIGALHATKNNIVVACSAGNSGPQPSTLSNPAPWIITVGASSVDRAFVSPLVLGNGMKIMVIKPFRNQEYVLMNIFIVLVFIQVHFLFLIPFQGQSVTPYKLKNKMYPLVFAADVVVPGVPKNLTAT